MKKIVAILTVLVLAGGGFYVWKNYKGALPAARKPDRDITREIPATGSSTPVNLPDAVNNTPFPLKLPKGFVISIFAKNLPGARVMALDGLGNIWVSQTSEGKISRLEIKDNKVAAVNTIFKNLNKPHGLAIDPAGGMALYFAEENKISKVDLYSEDSPRKIADLPGGGRHFTRTLGFGPDGRLYVSIGSTCDACVEKDPRSAAIYSMNKDGSDFKPIATGLRNSVFFTWSEVDGKMWATEMGRDYLGDNLPPDEINIIEEGKDYGWPYCYGQNIHDTNFDKNQYIRNPCEDKTPPKVELPAHSAPLGLAFVPEEGWPEDMWYNLLVAFHGSWNRTQPTGYKIERIKLDEKGNYLGMEDFISGWLQDPKKGALGRPVDIMALPGGVMYISDDKAGVIYKVEYLPAGSRDVSGEISVEMPKSGSLVTSPLNFSGTVDNSWFFEGTFPVELLDEDGSSLGTAQAHSKTDWTTPGKIDFYGQMQFDPPKGQSGTLVFRNDNPSDLPENAKEFRLNVKFK